MTLKKLYLPVLVVGLGATLACGGNQATETGGEPAAPAATASGGRDTIRIVGSSTVYPFTTRVAEQFGRQTGNPTPVVESTGTGGGFKLFCAGVGVDTPDLTNASRAIKDSEREACAANGVDPITEIEVGYDGIVLANSVNGPTFTLTLPQIYQALAKQVPDDEGQLKPNPYTNWKQIDASLPDEPIEVYGPPPTSGTRDAFVELAMEAGCQSWGWVKDLKANDEDRFKEICHSIREDGAYIEAGENDNLIVQKLDANPKALGIFGYSFLDRNRDKVQGATVGGAEPTFENIASSTYPISRPLFVYVKNPHVGVIPGIAELVTEYTSEAAMGPDGYLADLGLIPLSADELAAEQAEAEALASR